MKFRVKASNTILLIAFILFLQNANANSHLFGKKRKPVKYFSVTGAVPAASNTWANYGFGLNVGAEKKIFSLLYFAGELGWMRVSPAATGLNSIQQLSFQVGPRLHLKGANIGILWGYHAALYNGNNRTNSTKESFSNYTIDISTRILKSVMKKHPVNLVGFYSNFRSAGINMDYFGARLRFIL